MAVEKIQVLILGDSQKGKAALINSFSRGDYFSRDATVPILNPVGSGCGFSHLHVVDAKPNQYEKNHLYVVQTTDAVEETAFTLYFLDAHNKLITKTLDFMQNSRLADQLAQPERIKAAKRNVSEKDQALRNAEESFATQMKHFAQIKQQWQAQKARQIQAKRPEAQQISLNPILIQEQAARDQYTLQETRLKAEKAAAEHELTTLKNQSPQQSFTRDHPDFASLMACCGYSRGEWELTTDSFFFGEDPDFHPNKTCVAVYVIDNPANWNANAIDQQLNSIKEKKFQRLYFFINPTDPLAPNDSELTAKLEAIATEILGEAFPPSILVYGSTDNHDDVDVLFTTIQNQFTTHNDDNSTETDTEEENDNHFLKINKKSEWEAYLDSAEHWITQNRICFAGNLVILAIAMVFLILAASPVGAFLALGTLSAMGSVALLGFGAWVLWNAGCQLVEQLPLLRKPDVPNSKKEDNPDKFDVIIVTPKRPELHIFSPDLTNKDANKTEVNTNNDTPSDINSNKK